MQLSSHTDVAVGKAEPNEKGGIPTSVIRTLRRASGAMTNCMTDQTPTGVLVGQPQDAEGGCRPPTTVHSGNTDGTIRFLGNWPTVKEEAEEAPAQVWETQWQEFLSRVEVTPSMAPQFSQEPSPWDDTPAFLASFEQVAKAYQWPEEEWAARLLPTLKGEAELAFSSLEAGEREDYGKVKAAILRGDALNQEENRQRFRCFCYHQAESPRGAYNQLQELCRRWLKVERNSKEQILELLILEQFLTVLPPEIQSWVKQHNLESSTQAVSLAEDFVFKQWPVVVKEEQTAESQGEGSVSWSEMEGTPSDAEQRPPPSWESEMEEDTDFSDTDWSEGGKVHGNKEKSPQEISKRIQLQRMPPETANNNGSQFGASESWNSEESQQEIYPMEDRAILGQKANQTAVSQEIHKRRSCCSVCGKMFTRNLSRNLHKKTHKRGKLGICYQCQEAPLQKHQNSHSAGKPHKCLVCGKDFCDKVNLRKHEKIHCGEKSYICSDCGEAFMTRILLEEHRKHHVEKISLPPPEVTMYLCCECGENFNSALDHNAHQRTHKGQKPSVSSEHEKKICQEPDVQKHQETHTAEKPFKCSDCGESFSWISSYVRHRKLHSGNKTASTPLLCISTQSEKKCSCSMCGRAFLSLSKLRRHQCTHTGEKPYQGTDCGEQFMWRLSLDGDKKKIHNGKKLVPPLQKASSTEGETRIFSECGEHPPHLSQHECIRTGRRPYQCVDCGESFTLSRSLERHRKKEKEKQEPLLKNISNTQRKHTCSVCGKNFDRPSRLTVHQRVHTGEKPYQCTDCGVRFPWSTSLQMHMKIHNRKKLVPSLSKVPDKKRKSPKCSECGRTFSQASHLAQHKRIHSTEKPYQCTDCGERFMWRISLNVHIKKSHKGKKLVPVLQNISGMLEKFSSWSELEKNINHVIKQPERHTEEKPYKHGDSGESFTTHSSHAKHNERNKPESIPGRISTVQKKACVCSECGKSFKCPSELAQHQRVHTGEKIHQCPDCKESFVWRSTLYRHRKKIHGGKKSIICSECGKNFDYLSNLLRHQLSHAKEKSYQRAGCGEKFPLSSSLVGPRKDPKMEKQGGIVNRLLNTQEKKHMCSECGKNFDYASQLKRHLRIHTREKPYESAGCGGKSALSSSLEGPRKDDKTRKPQGLVKQLTSTQGRKHVCSECGQTYNQASSLKIHQRIHSGKKPYRCHDCGERFMWSSAIYRHKKKVHYSKKQAPLLQGMTDNGEEPHKVSKHGKSFDEQSHLRHQRTHSWEKSYKCSDCGKAFTRGAHLRRHQKVHVRKRLCKYKYCEQEKSFILKDSLEGGESPPSGLCQFSVQVFEDKPLQISIHQDECQPSMVTSEQFE